MTEQTKKTTAKRRTLTLPADLNDKLKRLSDEIFGRVMKTIFAFFFEGKSFNYEDFDSETKITLACIMPDLRRVQSQFDNGKSEKNEAKSTKGAVCPFEPSQIQPNSANSEPSIYNKNNNIYNNIYNKQTITNNNRQGGNDTKVYGEIKSRLEKLETSQQSAPASRLVARFADLISRVGAERKPLTINGEQLAPGQILERYLQIFEIEPEATIRKLERIFQMLDTACQERKITNTYKYCIALFYNQALSQEPVRTKTADFSTRNYTTAEMNGLYDDLDELLTDFNKVTKTSKIRNFEERNYSKEEMENVFSSVDEVEI